MRSTAGVRDVMAGVGSPEPADRDSIIREHFCVPSPVMSEKGVERWPINTGLATRTRPHGA